MVKDVKDALGPPGSTLLRLVYCDKQKFFMFLHVLTNILEEITEMNLAFSVLGTKLDSAGC